MANANDRRSKDRNSDSRVSSDPKQSGPFATTVRASDKAKGCTRSLTTDWFYRYLDNGEKVLRSWMIYSRAHECLYCFCCRLFAKDCEQGASSFVNTGFRTWWKLSPKIGDHESSPEHLSCFENSGSDKKLKSYKGLNFKVLPLGPTGSTRSPDSDPFAKQVPGLLHGLHCRHSHALWGILDFIG